MGDASRIVAIYPDVIASSASNPWGQERLAFDVKASFPF